ncbi:MAG: hypothetical protein J5900_06875 [Prevotella sp.]|nr:hypothetical protein [Prevotella sp.]MBO5642142.1 hypothetical protein [Prevotella sp.]
MTQKKKKPFVRPSLTMSPFMADEILACSIETGALDFGGGTGTGTGSVTTGGTGGGSFDWNTGQLGG